MSNFFHISIYKPKDAAGIHGGGVEIFARYLKRAIPDMQLLSFPDYPNWKQAFDEKWKDYDMAATMNAWLLRERIITEDDVVVCDGYWGKGLEGKVGRLITVVHGTYYGRFLQAQLMPWGEIVGMNHVEEQMAIYSHPEVEVVNVAKESVNELARAGIRGKDTVIYHGIDLDVYKPMHEGDVWMYGATSNRKGLDILDAVKRLLPDEIIEHMAEYSGIPERKAKRLNDAFCLLAPTRHEGNAYLLLEALACGRPLIAYATGLAIEMDERCGYITDDIAPQNFVRLMNKYKGLPKSLYNPREWAEENCDFERFAQDWRRFLCVS